LDPRQVLEENLALVERIVRSVCRRRSLVGDAADDFGGWVKLRLLENDGLILRRFEGRSSLAGYLTVVIWNLYRDHRIAEIGKWRPSAEARRRGEVAEQLEALLHRDGLGLLEATQVLRSKLNVEMSNREVAVRAAALPDRSPRARAVALEADVADDATPEGDFEESRRSRERARMFEALDGALKALPREDEAIVRMHWLEGHTLAAVARLMGLEQKPLYRRIDRRIRELQQALTAAGIDARMVRETVLAE